MNDASPGTVCWIDLATAHLGGAAAFYESLFGWQPQPRRANGGSLLELRREGKPLGSMYQLQQRALAHGAPSHWLPYVRVRDLDDSVARAVELGGETLVAPFTSEGFARIAIVVDPTGAPIGLWQGS